MRSAKFKQMKKYSHKTIVDICKILFEFHKLMLISFFFGTFCVFLLIYGLLSDRLGRRTGID
jgi:hypothetical protein